MSRYSGGWAPYVPVAERRRKAAREMEKLRKQGYPVAPVTITGRRIATTFWGNAWCDNMESYRDYESRLPRGRTYARNGSVVDLQIAPAKVTALVSGSELYRVTISVDGVLRATWKSICTDCTGAIGSLVELLQGRFSETVMARLCRQQDGLFPRPSEIRFSCSCLDHASMCKHIAAVLYGIGARLDHEPKLLFRLRAVNEGDLVAHLDEALAMAGKTMPAAGKLLPAADVSGLFDIEMAETSTTGQPPRKSKPARSRGTAPAADGAPAATKVRATRKWAQRGTKAMPGRRANERLRGRKPESAKTKT